MSALHSHSRQKHASATHKNPDVKTRTQKLHCLKSNTVGGRKVVTTSSATAQRLLRTAHQRPISKMVIDGPGCGANPSPAHLDETLLDQGRRALGEARHRGLLQSTIKYR